MLVILHFLNATLSLPLSLYSVFPFCKNWGRYKVFCHFLISLENNYFAPAFHFLK